MEKDKIESIEINDVGQLHLKTSKISFPMIYRTATEVHWNPDKHSLYSPQPRDWTYKMWFDHILHVAKKECNYILELSEDTKWFNIPDNLKQEIENGEPG